MTLLDTDILSLYFAGHGKVEENYENETDDVTTTVITRIEILAGRFASVIKAEDGGKLLYAQRKLRETEENLAKLAIMPLDAQAALTFDRLRENKKLKKIGRRDLLIASIALAQNATLVTRNVRHFQQVPGLKFKNWAD